MLRYTAAAVLVACLAIGSFVNAGGAAKLKIGADAPAWKDLPGVDGKMHSLADLKQDVVVLAITCNHCPVAVAYEDRIIALTKKYSGADSKVAVVAINVNNLEADKLDKMKIRAQEKGFNFAYLYDGSQKIAREYNAKVTPEFYVLDKGRKVAYWGAMDNSQNASKVTANYLEDAIQAVLKGEAPKMPQTKAFGCGVKYDSK